MPIVVDPGFSWPPEVDPVVSPDGKITAIVDPAHAGVLLRADFDDSVPDTPAQPEKVLRRNLEVGFGSTLSSWTTQSSATATLSPGAGESGKNAIKFTVGSNPANLVFFYQNSIVPISPGEWAGFGVSVKNDVGAPYFALRILFVNSSGATVGSSPYVGSVLQASSSYTRTFGAAQAPATAVGFRAYSYIRQSTEPGAPLANQSVLVSSWSVDTAATEDGAANSVETHFTGSTAASGPKRYRWTGTANASASEEYTPATPFIPGHGATTAKVRFERQDGSVVRSGNPAWAPGGYAHAYDHEATLGGGTLWRAVPIRFDGTEGTPSEYVGAVIPGLSDGWAWLKPVTDPDKAMLLKVEPPDLSYDGRVDTTSIAGAARPAATWDVLEGFTTQLRSLVREKDVEEQLKALLDEGPVLAQFPACAGLPDFYFIRGKLDLEHIHWDGWPWRRYQWDVTQIDRPDTTDSPLRIPGLSYDTVERDWTTYDQLRSTVVSYNKLLEP